MKVDLESLFDNNADYLRDVVKQAPPLKRDILAKLEDYLLKTRPNTFKVLSGLRRIGKTTILKQLISYLIKSSNKNENIYEQILFFSIDNLINKGFSIQEIKEFVGSQIREQKIRYIFVDEIQFIYQWDVWLKVLHDEFFSQLNKIKLIATGSSALELNRGESGIGRFEIIKVYPWSYGEYLNLNINKEDNETSFHDYLTFGQFPELRNFKNTKDKLNVLTIKILSWITDNLKEQFKIRTPKPFIMQIIRYIALTSNNEINMNKMLQVFSVYKLSWTTLNDILNFMVEYGLLLRLEKTKDGMKLQRRTNYKYYLGSPNLFFPFIGKTFGEILTIKNRNYSEFIGSITESVCLQKLLSKEDDFAFISFVKERNTNEEIDFGVNSNQKIKFYEIKYTSYEPKLNKFFLLSKGEKIVLTRFDFQNRLKSNFKLNYFLLREFVKNWG